MDLSIRTIREDEFEAYARAIELAFGDVPSKDDIDRERALSELDRSFAAFDGAEIVGGASAFTMPMTVPGGASIDVGYVTGVGVAPTHRRRGINGELMRRQLDDARERGELVEVLYASEGGIYGRFGYGLGTLNLGFDIRNDRSAFVRGVEPSGDVRTADARASTDRLLQVHADVRAERPGMVWLDERRFRYAIEHDHGPDKDRPLFCAIHATDGRDDGYVLYKITHDWQDSVPRSRLEVRDLQATDARAYAALWRFVFDVDLMERTTGWSRPPDEPLLHLLQEPRRLNATVRDGLWVRLVDVAAALEARRYRAAGRVTIEVDDRFCAWNAGRYALEVADDGVASVERTEAEADLTCSVNDVAAAYLGGIGFGQLARAGRVRELRPGAATAADDLFRSDVAPWCPYVF